MKKDLSFLNYFPPQPFFVVGNAHSIYYKVMNCLSISGHCFPEFYFLTSSSSMNDIISIKSKISLKILTSDMRKNV